MPGDDRAVVGAAAVAVQLDPVVEDPLDVVERVRAARSCRASSTERQVSSSVASVASRSSSASSARLLAADARRRAAAAGRAAGSAARAGCARRHRLKEPQEPRQVRALLGSGDDGVDVAEAQVVLGEREVVGQLLARDALDHARAGEGDQRARLGDRHVAERREARERAARRRMGEHDEDRAGRASCRSSTAQTVFGSCISEKIPSCMRAPPELETVSSGVPLLDRRVARARELLADRARPSSRP